MSKSLTCKATRTLRGSATPTAEDIASEVVVIIDVLAVDEAGADEAKEGRGNADRNGEKGAEGAT